MTKDEIILFKSAECDDSRRVVVHGFKLDNLTSRCELCGKSLSEEQRGTLTITNRKTGQVEKHFLCLECGKQVGGLK